MLDKKENNEFDTDSSIDKSQYEIEDEKRVKSTSELEATESVPVDEKKETIHFPWFIAIIIGVLMVLIIACFIVVMVLEHGNTATSSSNISTNLGVKIINFLYKISAIWYAIES